MPAGATSSERRRCGALVLLFQASSANAAAAASRPSAVPFATRATSGAMPPASTIAALLAAWQVRLFNANAACLWQSAVPFLRSSTSGSMPPASAIAAQLPLARRAGQRASGHLLAAGRAAAHEGHERVDGAALAIRYGNS